MDYVIVNFHLAIQVKELLLSAIFSGQFIT